MDCFGYAPGTHLDTLDVEGDVWIGGDLQVEGAIEFKEIKTDRCLTLDGTVSDPSHSFQDDDKTGMYRDTVTGDLRFSRNGVEQVRFQTGGTTNFLTPTVEVPTLNATVITRTPDLKLTPGGASSISSDSDMNVYTLGDNMHFVNNSFPTVDLNPTEMHTYVPVRSDLKMQGEYFTFKDDPDNSRLYYDTGDSSVKMQVGGDPSCKFRSKGIEAIEGLFDSMTAPSIVGTVTTTTDLYSTFITGTTTVTSTLSCTTQPITEFQNLVVQPVTTANVSARLIVGSTPSYSRGSSLVTFNTLNNYFQVPASGYYHVQWVVMWAYQPGGFRQCALLPYPVGAPYLNIDKRLAITTNPESTVTKGEYTAYMTSGDKFQVMLYQNSGATINVLSDSVFPTYVRWQQLY